MDQIEIRKLIKSHRRRYTLELGLTNTDDEWPTPQWLFDKLDAIFRFRLDVAATAANAKCRCYFTKKDNGLTKRWTGPAFGNFPFSMAGDFSRKALAESRLGATVVTITPNTVETRWFAEVAPHADVYAVEIRNEELLKPDHFKILKKHKVAHIFNAWTRMPTIGEQMEHDDAFTTDLIFARALLRPGRTYEQAVGMFEPYEKIQDPYPEGYKDVAALVRRGVASKARTYIAVNNRFVGNAVKAIEEILDELEADAS